MMFLDYEKVIRENYPILIESYVKQYGEEYREYIVSVLENVKYCFFVTPDGIFDYVERKTKEDYIKAILDSFVEVGIDISGIRIYEKYLEFEDNNIGDFSLALFPDLKNLKDIKEKGIFAFDSKYDFFDLESSVIKERMIVLEKLNIKSKDISYLDYYNSSKYKDDCLLLNKFLKIIEKNIDKRVEDYDEFLDYANSLENQILATGKKNEKEFMSDIKDFLCSEDRLLIENYNDFDLNSLNDYSLYFDIDLENDKFCFSDGPLDFFRKCFDEQLQDPSVFQDDKDEIIMMRTRYLQQKGFDVKKLESVDLYGDWYLIDEIKDFLPNKKCLNKILDLKEKYCAKFEYELALLCLINNFDLQPNDCEVSTIVEDAGCSCSVLYRGDKISSEDFCRVLCLCPFSDKYNLFDIAIDHEIRHAIEMSLKVKNNKFALKTGCDISIYDSNFEKGRIKFCDINERITQKLSVEATRDRWEKGQFIFSDEYALITSYPSSIYDKDFDNLSIIFEPFRKNIISSQISSEFNAMYKTISRRELRKINTLITEHDIHSIKKLKLIRNKILKRELKNKNISVKIKRKVDK